MNPNDKKILPVVAVYKDKYGLACALLGSLGNIENKIYYSDAKKVDEHYFGFVKGMMDEAKKKIGNYETEVNIINMIPESEHSKLEDPELLEESEYKKVRKELGME